MTDFEIFVSVFLSLCGCAGSGFIAWWYASDIMSSIAPSLRASSGMALIFPIVLAIMSMVWPWIMVDREPIMPLAIAIVITVVGAALNAVGLICGIRIAKRRKVKLPKE